MMAAVVILLVLALCGLPLVLGSIAELVRHSRRPW